MDYSFGSTPNHPKYSVKYTLKTHSMGFSGGRNRGIQVVFYSRVRFGSHLISTPLHIGSRIGPIWVSQFSSNFEMPRNMVVSNILYQSDWRMVEAVATGSHTCSRHTQHLNPSSKGKARYRRKMLRFYNLLVMISKGEIGAAGENFAILEAVYSYI